MRCESAHDASLIMNPGYSAEYTFDRAGIYEIHVVGLVDGNQSDYLAGMTGRRLDCADDSATPVTVLTGWLPDQAALNGVLNVLYDHRYTLVLVRRSQPDAAQVQ